MARQEVAVLVAHPDDETLWAGGTLLMQRDWSPFVVSACRASDADRAPKFSRVLSELGASGNMADLDDGPDQHELPDEAVEAALLGALPGRAFERILTHSPLGEYTRHRRHEEVSRAVLRLFASGVLAARELWLFAYDDAQRAHLPRAIEDADILHELPPDVWQRKRELVVDRYGFAPDSWEAQVTPAREAFFRIETVSQASDWSRRRRLS